MDELLRKAIERRDQLRRDLEAVDLFIRSYGAEQERDAPRPPQEDLFNARKRQSSRAHRAAQNAAAMADAEKLILEAAHPLSRSALLNALIEMGHEIEGGDKSKVLGTNLWRSKRFYNLKGAGYWPIKTPIPDEFIHLKPRESKLLD